MSLRPFVLWFFCVVLVVFITPEVRGQYAASPDAYSVTGMNALFGPAVNMQIYRDGSKVLVDQSHAALPGGQPSHIRTLYDLQTHQNLTWDLLNSAVPCGAALSPATGVIHSQCRLR